MKANDADIPIAEKLALQWFSEGFGPFDVRDCWCEGCQARRLVNAMVGARDAKPGSAP